MSGERRNRSETMLATREALLEAGLALFVELGIDSPSLDAICKRAGYTRGAFYVHFDNREIFVEEVVERVLRVYSDAIVETADAAGDVARSVRNFTTMMEEAQRVESGHPASLAAPHLRLLLQGGERSERLSKVLPRLVMMSTARIEHTFRAGQAGGQLRDDVDTAAAAELLVTAALGVILLTQGGAQHQAVRSGDLLMQMLGKGGSRAES